MTSKNPCIGCKDDYYNRPNPHGVKECMFKKKIKHGKCEYRYEMKSVPYK